uniref:SFRICE_010790 n=1 Tax=Spodoptera frugiperda TaxID=7108 RepID=A0A2H1V0A8_SPOFR
MFRKPLFLPVTFMSYLSIDLLSRDTIYINNITSDPPQLRMGAMLIYYASYKGTQGQNIRLDLYYVVKPISFSERANLQNYWSELNNYFCVGIGFPIPMLSSPNRSVCTDP